MRRTGLVASIAILSTAHAHAQAGPPSTTAPAQPALPPQAGPQPQPPQPYPAYPPYPGYPPPYAGYPAYPPSYGYPAPPGPPRTLHYEEGQAIPPGYYLDESVRRGPLIAGIIVLAAPYAIGFSVASSLDFQDSTGWLLLPVAGPWLTLATREESCDPDATFCDDDRAVRTLLVLDGLVQATGAVLIIWGVSSKTKRLIRQDVTLSVGPRQVASGYGIGALGRFF